MSSSLVVFLASVPPAPPERDGAFGFEFFLVMIIMIVAFIFLIQRPQAKEREARLKAVETMKKGDKIVSAGGIHGTVTKINKEKETVLVEVSKGFEIEFNKSSITVMSPPKEKNGNQEKNKKKGK
ncbi:MAG: preprotein translocase subunit YajC [Candidatus Sumerlaeia bacterium]|nr:preprotein translocase subunit YajC [Candidatus Sumerlaeia bacterium]